MQQDKAPKVSVCVTTYNQAEYIRQCLQSILDQETDFAFEVIIGDDCSTDGTRRIVQEFAERYPQSVRPILHEVHIGASKNIVYVHQQATGQYIAHMDGDDFMLPGKLRIQAEELDKNPDCTVCVHAMKRFDQHKLRYLKVRPKSIPRKTDINFLLMNLPFFSHSSKMYRAECRDDFPLPDGDILDCHFHVHHALKGKILYLNDVLGVYRMNVGVTSTSADNSPYTASSPGLLALVINAIDYAGRSGVEADLTRKAKAKAYFDFSYGFLLAKNFKAFQQLIIRSNETAKLHNVQSFFRFLSGLPSFLYLLVRLRARLRLKYEN